MSAAGVSRFHESARAQVAGAATYVDDIMTTYVHTPTIGFAIGWRER